MIDIEEVLRKHELWLDGEEGGERADLSGQDLKGMDLSGIGLSHSDLTDYNLSNTNLTDVNNATMSWSKLREDYVYGIILIGDNLTNVDL